MMTSSPSSSSPQGIQDIGLAAALRRLPQQLRAALVEHELDDAGVLEFYPRKPLGVLGLQDACTTPVLAATGGGTGAGIGYDVVPTLVLLFVIYCLLFIPYGFFSSSPSHPLFIFGFIPSAVFPVWLRIIPCFWVTQVVRKLSRRTKGKSSGSVAHVGVEKRAEKRADGCQTIVEVEEPCDFPTILHIFRDSQKTLQKSSSSQRVSASLNPS